MKLKMMAVAAAVVSMAGCSTSITRHVDASVASTDKDVSQIMRSTQEGNAVQGNIANSGVRKMPQVWMPISRVDEAALNKSVVVNRQVSVNRRFSNIADTASYITTLAGIPVSVTVSAKKAADDLVNQTRTLNGQTPGLPGMAGAGLPPAPNMVPGPMVGGLNPGAMNQQQLNSQLMPPITYSGKLSGLLDIVAARYGVFWEPDGENGIRLFKTKSQTFRLAALPGDSSMSSKVGTQASGGSSGGGSGGAGGAGGGAMAGTATSNSNAEQSSGIKFDGLSVWSAIENGIRTMLSTDGKVVVSPATGTVTVDDAPPVLEKVAEFIRDQNIALKRQVLLNVRVLSVELNDSDSYGINWDAVYRNLSSGANLALNSASGLASGANSLSFNIVKTDSIWDGTKVMLEALSKQGRVSQITSASIVTINNQPAPLQVGRQRSYLASSTTTIGTGGAGNTTTLQPGVVSTGFSMSVLPHILDGGKLMLQYSADISALVGIQTVSSGGSSIQTPEVDTRNFLQRVMIGNGETLALTGFEQFGANGNKQGIGSAENVLLGGSVNAANTKSVIVVLIQPVMNSVN